MTAQGEELLAFLDSAITAREQAAQGAARFYGPRWVRPIDTDMVRVSDDDIWFQALSDEIAEHVVYNGPESVLRRCAADRKVIELYRSYMAEPHQSHYADGGNRAMQQERSLPALRALRPVIQLLAEGYGWTEGER